MKNFYEFESRSATIAVMGLGYVGLPLAVAFSLHFDVIGFDISQSRISELENGHDHTNEVSDEKLNAANIYFTADPCYLSKADIIIVAVPTPIDSHKKPNLTPVIEAINIVGAHMAKGTVICFESTVYPGLTEEICIPLLEKKSGMKFSRDFTVGYSPERINPGDKIHTLENITKIVSGSDEETANLLVQIYGRIIKAGIYRACSIKVAEAAKVIENTQRDLNIALMNELSIIFNLMGIDTLDVLKAAGTKWNFMNFTPGLVGGHCIGVDPYYLTFKAEELGYHPEVILAGRRINDAMGRITAHRIVKIMISKGNVVRGSRVGILGFTFKENVPDLRNTRVVDIISELKSFGLEVLVSDAKAYPDEALSIYNQELLTLDEFNNLDALIIAVSHTVYKKLTPQKIKSFFKKNIDPFVFDIKGLFDKKNFLNSGIDYVRI